MAGWAGAGTWVLNLLLWNRHWFDRWGSDDHLALDLQSHLSVCLVDLVPQISGHSSGHVAVQPLASGESCTCLLLNPYWFMGWKTSVQMELKYRGHRIQKPNVRDGFVFKRAALSACMAFTTHHWLMRLTPAHANMFVFVQQVHAPSASPPIPVLNRVKFNPYYSWCYFGEEKE